MKEIVFYFDFGSPTAYLAATQLSQLSRECGAKLSYRPILLGAVFKATGNRSPVEVPAKAQYMLRDLQRFAARYQVPFKFNSAFPINTLPLMRVATAVQADQPERFAAFAEHVFAAVWAKAQNLGDSAVLGAVVAEAGFDSAQLLAASTRPEMKDRLRAETDSAVARGVFGVPTMFVGEQMFFGQDRLDFVREALG